MDRGSANRHGNAMTKKTPKDGRAWVVYLLRCKDGSLYCGTTNDLVARLEKHNQGKGAKYTRSRRPVKLAAFMSVMDKSTALKMEHKIKGMSKADKESICCLAMGRVPAYAATAVP